MAMLLDRSASLATKIAEYRKLKSTAQEADQFATRATQFSQVALLIAQMRQTLEALTEAGVPIDFEPNNSRGYADKARTLREAIKDDPAKISDPPFNIKHDFTDRLNAVANAGDKAAREAWKAYVDKRAAFGAEDVLSTLAAVPQFKASVAKIRQIRSEIAGFGITLPSDPKAAIIKLDALVAQHEAAWALLDASDIPPSVIAFVRAAANGDALLSSFTPQVQEWLESRDLLGAFRIKLR